ncbi:MAG TPA: hypothetical protein PLC53_02120 [Bacilli bacterium]|nr:hypothetical protein [Bacilli bacterium]
MKNKFLLFLVILIALSVGVLGYYTYFIYEEGEEVVVTKEDLTDNEMSEVLDGFPYASLLDATDKGVSDLTSEEILLIGYSGLTENDIIENGAWNCDESEENSDLVKCIVESFGLAEAKVEELDTSLWETVLGGSTGYEMFSKELLIKKISDRLGITEDYNESFVKTIEISGIPLTFIYDNNVNMFFTHQGGAAGPGTTSATSILDGYNEGNTYVINIVKGMFDSYEDGDSYYYKLYAESNSEEILKEGIDFSDLEAYVEEYADQLDNYKLTFKKVGDTYQFVSIEMVN